MTLIQLAREIQQLIHDTQASPINGLHNTNDVLQPILDKVESVLYAIPDEEQVKP